MIENRQLTHCQALAEHGHFGRAAESLRISQPALTRSIQNLEQSLGVRLFNRRRGQIEPTAIGQVLLDRGERILTESEELIRQIQLVRGLEVGQLVVSAGLFPAILSVHRAVGRLIRKHPKLVCQVKLCDWRQVAEDVLSRKADIGLAELSEAKRDPQLVTQLVANHPISFFVHSGHPLIGMKKLSLNQIFKHPLVGTRGPGRMLKYFPKDLGASGWIDESNGDFVPAIQVDSITAAIQIVMESNAIAAAHVRLVEQELALGKLVELPFHKTWLRLNYGFIFLRDRTLSPAAEGFMKEVEAVERSLTT